MSGGRWRRRRRDRLPRGCPVGDRTAPGGADRGPRGARPRAPAAAGIGGTIGLVAVGDDFFVAVRILGDEVLVFLSDVTASVDWPLARQVLTTWTSRFPTTKTWTRCCRPATCRSSRTSAWTRWSWARSPATWTSSLTRRSRASPPGSASARRSTGPSTPRSAQEAVERLRSQLEPAMRAALARAACGRGMPRADVPVGAVVLDADRRAHRRRAQRARTDADPTAHAEIVAIRAVAAARQRLAAHRAPGRHPGTLHHARGASARPDGPARVRGGGPQAGAVGSLWDMVRDRRLNHRPEVISGVLEVDCAAPAT